MKQFFALLLSILIMGIIFARIDLQDFRTYLSEMSAPFFIVAVLLFIPQIMLTAYRWRMMAGKKANLSLWESIRLVLAGNALNILLPSRVGDLSKAYFVGREGRLAYQRGMNVVFFEKYIDLAALGMVILTGIVCSREWDRPTLAGLGFSGLIIGLFPILYFVRLNRWLAVSLFERNRFFSKLKEFLLDTQAYFEEIKKNTPQLIFILSLSIFLWFLHLFQFYIFFLALHSGISIFHVFRLVPLAILAGLIPLTIAGVGTRDSAMLYFFGPYEEAALIVGVGIFASLRYFVPGILGLPFLNRYLVKDRVNA